MKVGQTVNGGERDMIMYHNLSPSHSPAADPIRTQKGGEHTFRSRRFSVCLGGHVGVEAGLLVGKRRWRKTATVKLSATSRVSGIARRVPLSLSVAQVHGSLALSHQSRTLYV